MNIKINYSKIIFSSMITAIFFSSCQSHEPNGNEAFNKVKEEKANAKETKDTVVQPKKEADIKKPEVVDAWTVFKNETENRITLNEVKIKTIKGTPNVNVKLLRRVTLLEKENNDLRIQLSDYQKEVQERWLNFKVKINTDLDDMNKEFAELTPKKL